jgi:hypothetical protein
MSELGKESVALPRDLGQDLEVLEAAWRPVLEAELPTGLTSRTLARLRQEGVADYQPRSSRSARWSAMAGVAAALLLVSLGTLLEPRGTQGSLHGSSWADGLVVEEEFDSMPQEVAARLERVQQLLAEDLSVDLDGNLTEADELRLHMENLSQELEAF